MAEISPHKTRSIDSVDDLGSDTDFNLRGSFEVLHFPEGKKESFFVFTFLYTDFLILFSTSVELESDNVCLCICVGT